MTSVSYLCIHVGTSAQTVPLSSHQIGGNSYTITAFRNGEAVGRLSVNVTRREFTWSSQEDNLKLVLYPHFLTTISPAITSFQITSSPITAPLITSPLITSPPNTLPPVAVSLSGSAMVSGDDVVYSWSATPSVDGLTYTCSLNGATATACE